jgi:hypothetical protein
VPLLIANGVKKMSEAERLYSTLMIHTLREVIQAYELAEKRYSFPDLVDCADPAYFVKCRIVIEQRKAFAETLLREVESRKM